MKNGPSFPFVITKRKLLVSLSTLMFVLITLGYENCDSTFVHEAVQNQQPETESAVKGFEADLYLGKNRVSFFSALVERISDFQVVSQVGLARVSTTWKKELNRSKNRFTSARTKQDVYYALSSLQRSFHDAHSFLNVDHAFARPRQILNLPLGVEVYYDAEEGGTYSYVISRSNVSSVPTGSILISIDGQPLQGGNFFNSVEYDFFEWYPSTSPEGLREFVAENLFLRDSEIMPLPTKNWIEVAFVNGINHRKEKKSLRWNIYGSAQENATNAGDSCPKGQKPGMPSIFAQEFADLKLINHGHGYCIYQTHGLQIIQYPSFNYDHRLFERDIAQLDRYLQNEYDTHGPQQFLIDVRENQGGDFSPEFTALFADKPFYITKKVFYFGNGFLHDPTLLENRDVTEVFPENLRPLLAHILDSAGKKETPFFSTKFPFFCQTNSCRESESLYKTYPNRSNSYVLLVSHRVVSSGDNFVNELSMNEFAKLAGTPEGAASAPFRMHLNLQLQEGTPFSIRLTCGRHLDLKNEVVEGNPKPLDYPVYLTKENSSRYLDAVIRKIGWR